MAHGPAKGVRCPQSSGTCGRRAWRGAAARSLNPGFSVSRAHARRTNRNRKDGRFPARRLRLGAVGAGGSPGSSGGPVRPTPDGSPVRHGAAHRHSGGGSAAHEHPTRAPREEHAALGGGQTPPGQWARPGPTRAEGVKVDVERAPLTQGRAESTSAGHCVHSRAEHDVTRQPQLPTPFSVAGTGHGSAPHGRSGAQFTSSICEAGEGAGERRSAPGWGRPGRGCEEPFAGPSDLARPAAVCPPDS